MFDHMAKILDEVKRRRQKRPQYINDMMDQISSEEIYEDDKIMADIARKYLKTIVHEMDILLQENDQIKQELKLEKEHGLPYGT